MNIYEAKTEIKNLLSELEISKEQAEKEYLDLQSRNLSIVVESIVGEALKEYILS